MSVWLVRAGGNGQYEEKFLKDNRIYLTWGGLDLKLDELNDRDELITQLQEYYPDSKYRKITNHASQIWPFGHVMAKGEMVILPSKLQPVMYIGHIKSEYQFDGKAESPFYHYRKVKWEAKPVPRSHFSQDLLYSLGAFLTICQIKRNNAEERLHNMADSGWQPETTKQVLDAGSNKQADAATDELAESDLTELANNQIVSLIEAKFKGHDLTSLITAILEAQGYTAWQSPEGADGGVDILACDGPMGFGDRKICVEVKSGTAQVDRPTVDKLIGAMTKFNANQGLFVSWSGFKSNVQKELASSFFNVRLWTRKEILEQLFLNYEKLNGDIKAELPLKQIWTVARDE